MAQRKSGSVAAPAKQKLRKKHGPKRHMFKEFKPMVATFAKCGVLTKYYNYESFQLFCASRNIKSGMFEMWEEFRGLSMEDKKKYLKEVQFHSIDAVKKAELIKKKNIDKMLKQLEKVK